MADTFVGIAGGAAGEGEEHGGFILHATSLEAGEENVFPVCSVHGLTWLNLPCMVEETYQIASACVQSLTFPSANGHDIIKSWPLARASSS